MNMLSQMRGMYKSEMNDCRRDVCINNISKKKKVEKKEPIRLNRYRLNRSKLDGRLSREKVTVRAPAGLVITFISRAWDSKSLIIQISLVLDLGQNLPEPDSRLAALLSFYQPETHYIPFSASDQIFQALSTLRGPLAFEDPFRLPNTAYTNLRPPEGSQPLVLFNHGESAW